MKKEENPQAHYDGKIKEFKESKEGFIQALKNHLEIFSPLSDDIEEEELRRVLEILDGPQGSDEFISAEEFPHQANRSGVAGLINDIQDEVYNFQAESIEENENIIFGLKRMIEALEKENQWHREHP
jgi:hypothetical protein